MFHHTFIEKVGTLQKPLQKGRENLRVYVPALDGVDEYTKKNQ